MTTRPFTRSSIKKTRNIVIGLALMVAPVPSSFFFGAYIIRKTFKEENYDVFAQTFGRKRKHKVD